MKRFLLVLALGLAVGMPCRADSGSPMLVAPSVHAIKWSLQVLQPRVAAGGLTDEVHRSEFVVRAFDDKGNALVGVPVELPHIWNDKGEIGDGHTGSPEIARPRVEWLAQSKTVRTDTKGEARGRFTSGASIEALVLRGPGDSRANIEQVWNDQSEPFGDWKNSVTVDRPWKARYTFTVRRGYEFVPVTGHELKLLLKRVAVLAYRRTGLFDGNGQPQLEEKSVEIEFKCPQGDATPEEKARWEIVSSWFHMTPLKEVAPGVYEGTATPLSLPGRSTSRPVVDGLEISSLTDFGIYVQDKNVYSPEARPALMDLFGTRS